MEVLNRSFRHKTLEERAAEYDGELNLEGELDWRGDPVGSEVPVGKPAACGHLHPNAVRTGRKREDISCPLWTRHQFEYRCPDCGMVFWKDAK